MNPDPNSEENLKEESDHLGRALQETIDTSNSNVESDLQGVTYRLDERYELVGLHATGGIGRIWLARDKNLDRSIALKDLRPERSGDADVEARFLQEARFTGKLEHPGIVPVYELANRCDSRPPYYTMRFLQGRTLAAAAADYHRARTESRDEGLDLLTLLNAFVAVCKTVAYAHSRAIVHRDLKGQNVVIGDFGEVVVLDWGLAKDISSTDANVIVPIECNDLPSDDARLTHVGQAIGTPGYMAPEQAAGRNDLVDQRTDVYGLGALLYEILTGQPPFVGSDTKEVLQKLQTEQVVPPSQLNDEVSEQLEATCLKALAKEPSSRYASASDLAYDVERWQEVQRKQAEQALRDSEALYRSLVDALPIGLVRKDRTSRFTFGNNHFCETWGLSPEQVVGMSDSDLSPPDIAEKYQRDDKWVMKTGKTIETTERGPEGDKMSYVHTIKTPVYDARGQIVGVQVVWWDVSERKQLEQDLARVTAELQETRQELKTFRQS